MAPAEKDMTTDMRIPEIMARALAELMYSLMGMAGSFMTLIMETPTAAPSSSKIMDTVVEVGSPKVLNRSSNTTSVIMTARKMIMISWK